MNKSAVIRRCPKSDITDKKPKSEQKYCLYNSKGTKVLGRHPSKEKAMKQEKAIQVHKHSSIDEKIINEVVCSYSSNG